MEVTKHHKVWFIEETFKSLPDKIRLGRFLVIINKISAKAGLCVT
jgi:hypothetical protein